MAPALNPLADEKAEWGGRNPHLANFIGDKQVLPDGQMHHGLQAVLRVRRSQGQQWWDADAARVNASLDRFEVQLDGDVHLA